VSETVFVTNDQVSDPVTFIDNERGVIDLTFVYMLGPSDSIKVLYIAKLPGKKRES
jgi:hypothetical protein